MITKIKHWNEKEIRRAYLLLFLGKGEWDEGILLALFLYLLLFLPSDLDGWWHYLGDGLIYDIIYACIAWRHYTIFLGDKLFR